MTVGTHGAVLGIHHDIIKESINWCLQCGQTRQNSSVVVGSSQRGNILLRLLQGGKQGFFCGFGQQRFLHCTTLGITENVGHTLVGRC